MTVLFKGIECTYTLIRKRQIIRFILTLTEEQEIYLLILWETETTSLDVDCVVFFFF